MPEFIQGTCEGMCPLHEIKLRTKEHILHFFEQKPGEKNVPGIVVKSFSRSAAGVKTPRKSDLRTPRALEKTVEYLLKDILMDKRKPLHFTYDFIFDRLRCVRQEIVMQNLDARITLNLLEPIIMFLAYSRYRLCMESIDNFDPIICDRHLQECLKKALCCYDELDLAADAKETVLMTRKRSLVEALYQVFNLGSHEALARSLKIPARFRDPMFYIAQQMSLELYRNNNYKVIDLMKRLPHILAAIASLKLASLRIELYKMFSVAYNSKTLTVPIEWLQKILLYSDRNGVTNDCKYYGIELKSDGISVRFLKGSFINEKSPPSGGHEKFVEEKLEKLYLPEILLLKRL